MRYEYTTILKPGDKTKPKREDMTIQNQEVKLN